MTTAFSEQTPSPRRSLDVFFSKSAQRFPSRPALYAAGQLWSYGQLDAESAKIAAALNMQGANIGLLYARSAFSYAAILAIMRSGNVYVPLNPKMPAQRLLRMIEDAGIQTLIVDTAEGLSEGVAETLKQCPFLRVLTQESDTGPASGKAPTNPSNGLAYIIYTSGSTGTPKGVAVTHESACRCIEKSQCVFGISERDRFTQFSALSFDVSILDLFLCWKSGATLYVPEASEAMVPLKFATTHGITVWSSVPSLANFLLKLQLLKPNALRCVRLFLFCGEALPAELARALMQAAAESRIFNLYGPTECTIFATYYEYDRESGPRSGIVPIGAPLPGVSCKIVDEGHAVDLEDVPGELWLAGDQLAREYWNNPASTRAAFVRRRFDDTGPDIWYRTGDLVCQRKESGLSFRGRLDRQIKLRGFRIELQEIESALRDVIGCALVAVIPVRNSGGICEKIIAYCDSLGADEAMIKSRCLNRIPSYMVPDRIVALDTFPLNESGKINYMALAARAV
jgi:D-alanine--poly(phosphoribitol) ligase subunit 1